MEEYKRWILKAEDDLDWAKHSIDSGVYYGACFAAQQAAEKALKSFLLRNKLPLRKTHDLVALLEDCIKLDENFEKLRDFAKILFFYYLETRYPDFGDFEKLDKAKAKEAYSAASRVIDFVKSKS